MITAKKLSGFIRRWNEIEAASRDTEFMRAELARDLRREFATGKTGDMAMTNAVLDEFPGVTPGKAFELLAYEKAIVAIPDAYTWSFVGGFKVVRKLAELKKKDRDSVIADSKRTGKAVSTILRERQRKRTAPASAKAPNVRSDMQKVADYVHRHMRRLPPDIREIIDRYIEQERTLRAVA